MFIRQTHDILLCIYLIVRQNAPILFLFIFILFVCICFNMEEIISFNYLIIYYLWNVLFIKIPAHNIYYFIKHMHPSS